MQKYLQSVGGQRRKSTRLSLRFTPYTSDRQHSEPVNRSSPQRRQAVARSGSLSLSRPPRTISLTTARSKQPSSSATPAGSAPGAASFAARPGATVSSGFADRLSTYQCISLRLIQYGHKRLFSTLHFHISTWQESLLCTAAAIILFMIETNVIPLTCL